MDGGACANNLLMQFQAGLLGVPVLRPKVAKTTALGAAYLAGRLIGNIVVAVVSAVHTIAMKSLSLSLTVGLVALGVLNGPLPTAAAAELGMAAPPLEIATWVQGSKVNLAAGKGSKVFVVEFWATWCPPCKTTIPHLNELHHKYAAKGVVIIGITGELTGKVKSFLKEMKGKMDYTVAVDQKKKTSEAYMKAFGQEAIPYAFIVNKEGQIAWAGSPFEDTEAMDKALEQIVAGTYDLKQVIFAAKFRERIHDYLHLAAEGDSPLARAAGRKLLEDGAKHPDLLNDFAWEILTHEHGDINFRDKKLAVEAARTANTVTGGKDASILDTYALALFESGSAGEAVKVQQEAIRICEDKELIADLKERLERYQKTVK